MPEQNVVSRSPLLQGKRILVTRTREQASALSERLHALGAVPIEFPTIRIVPPEDWSTLDQALRRLYKRDNGGKGADYSYDWLIFTSANGVHWWYERAQALDYDPQALQGVRVATIGPATAAALQRCGVTADLVPRQYVAEGVAAALLEDAQMRGATMAGQHILLPRAAEARKVLVTELQQAGAQVDEVAVYHTVPVAGDDERGREVLELLRQRQLDVITFTSSSTVRYFMAWLEQCLQAATNDPASRQAVVDALQALTIASIGPITSQTAGELGLHVAIEASEFTIEGLVSAIVHYKE